MKIPSSMWLPNYTDEEEKTDISLAWVWERELFNVYMSTFHLSLWKRESFKRLQNLNVYAIVPSKKIMVSVYTNCSKFSENIFIVLAYMNVSILLWLDRLSVLD